MRDEDVMNEKGYKIEYSPLVNSVVGNFFEKAATN